MGDVSKHTPGPWRIGHRTLTVQGPSEKGGTFPVCDIRGWGYLTGKGHGALGLDHAEAEAIQDANALLIASAPEMLAALKDISGFLKRSGYDGKLINSVIAKAEGRE